jgi:hypothetical protein
MGKKDTFAVLASFFAEWSNAFHHMCIMFRIIHPEYFSVNEIVVAWIV